MLRHGLCFRSTLFSGRTASSWRFRPRKTGICGWCTRGSDAAKVVLLGGCSSCGGAALPRRYESRWDERGASMSSSHQPGGHRYTSRAAPAEPEVVKDYAAPLREERWTSLLFSRDVKKTLLPRGSRPRRGRRRIVFTSMDSSAWGVLHSRPGPTLHVVAGPFLHARSGTILSCRPSTSAHTYSPQRCNARRFSSR
jgi:hypothetical protein